MDGIFGGGGGNGPIKTMLRKKCKRVCKIEKLRIVCTPISKIGAGFDDEYFDDDEVRVCVCGGVGCVYGWDVRSDWIRCLTD